MLRARRRAWSRRAPGRSGCPGAGDGDDLVHGGAQHVGGRVDLGGRAGARVRDRGHGVVGGVPHELAPELHRDVARERWRMPASVKSVARFRPRGLSWPVISPKKIVPSATWRTTPGATSSAPISVMAPMSGGRSSTDGEQALVLDAVLQRQHDGVVAHDRRDLPRHRGGVVRLDGDEHEPERLEPVDALDGGDAREVKVAVDALDREARRREAPPGWRRGRGRRRRARRGRGRRRRSRRRRPCRRSGCARRSELHLRHLLRRLRRLEVLLLAEAERLGGDDGGEASW